MNFLTHASSGQEHLPDRVFGALLNSSTRNSWRGCRSCMHNRQISVSRSPPLAQGTQYECQRECRGPSKHPAACLDIIATETSAREICCNQEKRHMEPSHQPFYPGDSFLVSTHIFSWHDIAMVHSVNNRKVPYARLMSKPAARRYIIC